MQPERRRRGLPEPGLLLSALPLFPARAPEAPRRFFFVPAFSSRIPFSTLGEKMRSDAPRDLLLAALTHEPGLNRLEMHAFLHRLCGRHVIELQNFLREPMWERWAGSLQDQIGPLCRRKDWLALVAREARTVFGADRALVFAATLLRLLDKMHIPKVRDFHATRAILPPALGSGETLFLAPPEAPIAELVPESRRLGRGRGDLKSDLRDVLGLWWYPVPLDRHTVEPNIGPLDARVAREMAHRLSRQGDLRIGLASPFADLHYVVRSDPARSGGRGTPYRFSEISPDCLNLARAGLEEIFHLCAKHRIDVLCFPELTLDGNLLHHLQLLLKLQNPSRHPLLVVAGSFHADAGERWVNRCRLLGGSGEPLSTQDKCAAYNLPGAQVTPHLGKTLGLDGRGGYEDIDQSTVLEVLDTPLGRLATPICLDFCGEQLRDLLVDACVNLLLVPAMTPQMKPFVDRARDLGTQNRAVTFAVNSSWLLRQIGASLDQDSVVLAYLPAHPLAPSLRMLSDALYSCSIRELLGLP